jgi:hypothetical protein
MFDEVDLTVDLEFAFLVQFVPNKEFGLAPILQVPDIHCALCLPLGEIASKP